MTRIRLLRTTSSRGFTLSSTGAWLVIAGFAVLYGVVAGRMGVLASDAVLRDATPVAAVAPAGDSRNRADIVDRRGRLVATNLPVATLFAHPPEIVDPEHTAARLKTVFPELDVAKLAEEFSGERHFVWVHRNVMPDKKQEVLDLGLPGLHFGDRMTRAYPHGALLAHIVGGVRHEKESVLGSRIEGVAGIELRLDERLRTSAAPVRLTVDLPCQAAVHSALAAGVDRYRAKGGSAVLMDIRSGEVISLVSLPDFDPNARPVPGSGLAEDHPTFNRAAQGVYELGSVLKPITAGLVMDKGSVDPETPFDTSKPLRVGGFQIRDFHRRHDTATLYEAVTRSSNIAIATAALGVGAVEQKKFLHALGLLDVLPIELAEASGSRPLVPDRWRPVNVATISFGHGIAITPVHLAAAYAAIAGDGRRVIPTLLLDDAPAGESDSDARRRVVSPKTVRKLRELLRGAVVHGTGRNAGVPGYELGGKTGTADKPLSHRRGYGEDRVLATFASVFPARDPAYVLVVTLDEPEGEGDSAWRRIAGNTAAPVTAQIVRRVAPILGVLPVAPKPGSQPEDVRALRLASYTQP